jgi:tetratricopeptide (TPR) repeat protein
VACAVTILLVLVFPAMQKGSEGRLEEAQARLAESDLRTIEWIDKHYQAVEDGNHLIDALKKEINEWEIRVDIQERTNRVLNAYNLLTENRVQEAVDLTDGLNHSGLASDIIEKAEGVKAVAFPLLAREFYDAGVNAYDRDNDRVKALNDFEKSLRYISGDANYFRNLLYYLALLYAEDTEMLTQALDYLRILQDEHPDFNRNRVTQLINEVEAAMEG